MMLSHRDLDYASHRLQLVGSRVVEPEDSGHRVIPTQHHHHHQHHHHVDSYDEAGDPSLENGKRHTPKFLKTHSATNFELFYDLWFVANLSVFTSKHDISDKSKFSSFIGYIVLLWTTWLLTTLYDVRFTADSVWERCCKAIHLGVMIGFAEIGAAFDPNDQIVAVFRAMSLFLAVSRLVLAFQYGMVLFQIRTYAHGKRPMFITALFHFVAAAIYFGVSFRYDLGKTSRVFLVWYIGGVVEMALHLRMSQLSHVLTFLGTHMGERLNLLTLIILGEGCIILAKSITLLVKDTYLKDPSFSMWSSNLIGLVAAGTALIYIIFQLYFDWMHDEHSMSRRHQVMWTVVHLPFHIALTLLVEGANQFIVWARILETSNAALSKVVDLQSKFVDMTSKEVSEKLASVIKPFLEKYQPADVEETMDSVNETLEHIADIPNSFWKEGSTPDSSTLVHYQNDLIDLMNTMVNAVYTAFEIEPPEGEDNGPKPEYWQSEAAVAVAKRFRLVYIYAFSCAGIVLLMLTIMHIISKRRGWTPFNIFRTAACISISIILALLTLVVVNQEAVFRGDRRTAFYGSSWMLPAITIGYFVVLVLTHLPHPTGFWMGNVDKGTYKTVNVPRDPKGLQTPPPILRNNHHLMDYEDGRVGSSSGEYDTVSPPLPRYEDRRAREARRQRRSRERRSQDVNTRGRRRGYDE
ncbi:uncharacterized protein F4812DRAFT_419442 [Daldinia caldariorum]|uniref:uncharacterized protein n=1 Tax=Daldinia caldariorum TaxID=326644 RepID=UPI002008B4D4|nr:uncharacterized protein F4812DRAFT_419442 [Daldinia caldariorum]KAI1470912.1 hypothetical protein F4812DRAFT_419442 [Daldinia caldariorum]